MSADTEGKKYQTYSIEVDPNQDDKATEIKLTSMARPHMRAFHFSWMSFHLAFFIWFAIAPLLSEVKVSLDLTKQTLWSSSIASVAGTILMRFINGPLCDKYGARLLMGGVLMAASIPTACTGLIQSGNNLIFVRFFIGLGGSTFVMCQYWTTSMFTKEVAGTANALVGGWGNLGGGVTQIVMGSLLFPLFKQYMDAESAWRSVSIVPAAVAFCFGIAVLNYSDDCPKGNYKDLMKSGVMGNVSASASFRAGAFNLNTWYLFFQYACCFGVELTMNNAAALYFRERFDLSTEQAAAIASLFGWMNLFARGLGGYYSDKMNAKSGMHGRLWAQTWLLLGEGLMVLVFANSNSFFSATGFMVIFSLFVQGAEGSTYGIVPYVNPPATGSIAGIVGAGGNTGAVIFGLCFRNMPYKKAFTIMGCTILASALTSFLIVIQGHSTILDKDAGDQKGTDNVLELPPVDVENGN